jgi:carboxylate-amine ligase
VLLGDGAKDPVGWEAGVLARDLAIGHVALADLAHRGDRLVERASGRAVDVVYRRTAEERLRGDDGRLNALGEALLAPLRAGTLAVVNAFGTGVADDKRTYAHVEDLVRLFCGEEPLLRSVPTLDLGRAEDREEALDRMGELVFKPRSGSGGHGLLFGPHATPPELDDLAARIRARPGDWVAQALLRFGTHPTVVDGALVPRHVDLRPFVVGGRALPGGLSRVALGEGELVVNLSQGGGGKDTWVLGA